MCFGEQPSAAKWNILGSNDSHFYTFLGDLNTNYPTFTSAATGNAPQISATGGDTDIGLKGVAKGAGINQGFLAVKVGTLAPTGNGNFAVTGLGFRPKLVEFANINSGSRSASVAMEVRGVMDSSGNQWASGFRAEESSDISGSVTTSFVCFNASTGQGRTNEIAYVSMDSDGFTVVKTNHNSNIVFGYIAYG